jgi:hydroxymethylbilane synthase
VNSKETIFIATRGSALALAQANLVMAQCRDAFPELTFALNIIKTTGDKLQTASLAQEGGGLPKGLFTKELEVALLEKKASLAVHSLKDLPTELPAGLKLGAVGKRADVRDVLIYRENGHPSGNRGFKSNLSISELPAGAVVATSSTRRKAQLLTHNSKLKVIEIRGNVLTRLEKVARLPEMDATVLALAGLTRLNYSITSEGRLIGEGVPEGLFASVLDTQFMLPCVGQGAIGIEVRQGDEQVAKLCERLNDYNTMQAVTAERAFLSEMGGGCQSPVAAFAEIAGEQISMRTLSFTNGPVRHAEGKRPSAEAAALGHQLAQELR